MRAISVTGAGRAFCAGADAAALEGHIEKGGYDPGTNAAELASGRVVAMLREAGVVKIELPQGFGDGL